MMDNGEFLSPICTGFNNDSQYKHDRVTMDFVGVTTDTAYIIRGSAAVFCVFNCMDCTKIKIVRVSIVP